MNAITEYLCICFAGDILALVVGIIWVFHYCDEYKVSEKKRKPKLMFNILCGCACVILFLVSIGLTEFDSRDVRQNDYITTRGVLLDQHRDRNRYKLLFDTNADGLTDEVYYIYLRAFDGRSLECGKQYEFIYGKRTKMLVEFKEIQLECN